MTRYFVRSRDNLYKIHDLIVETNWVASTFYYGDIVLSRRLSDEEAEALDLVEWTEDRADSASEANRLYNAEMRHCL